MRGEGTASPVFFGSATWPCVYTPTNPKNPFDSTHPSSARNEKREQCGLIALIVRSPVNLMVHASCFRQVYDVLEYHLHH